MKQYIPIIFIAVLIAFGYIMGDKHQRIIQSNLIKECQKTYHVECGIVAQPIK